MARFDLTGRVALVTGGSRGLGEAIAKALAEQGADLIVTARDPADAEPTAEAIRALGRRAVALPLDVRSLESIQSLDQAVHHVFDRVDILVNNAGINIPQPALEVTPQNWAAVLDINLTGLFFVTQTFGRRMVERGSGRVINIASQMGLVGGANRAAYCASKGGVVQLTKVLGIEWAQQGVTVNAVAPTFIETPLTRPFFEDQAFLADVLRRIPQGTIGQPEDVAAAVIYLASNEARLVTGTTLVVDGGWTAW